MEIRNENTVRDILILRNHSAMPQLALSGAVAKKKKRREKTNDSFRAIRLSIELYILAELGTGKYNSQYPQEVDVKKTGIINS